MDLQEIYKALRSEYNGKTWSDEFMGIHVTLKDDQVICWFDLDRNDEGFEEKRDCAISFYDEVVRFLVDRFGEEFKYEDPRISADYIDRNNMYGQYDIVLDDDGENAPVIAIWENEENEMKPRINENKFGKLAKEDANGTELTEDAILNAIPVDARDGLIDINEPDGSFGRYTWYVKFAPFSDEEANEAADGIKEVTGRRTQVAGFGREIYVLIMDYPSRPTSESRKLVKENDDMEKEFVCKGVSITRYDYEFLPDPMAASQLDDETMQKIACDIYDYLSSANWSDEEISKYLGSHLDDVLDDDWKGDEIKDEFWRYMEKAAIENGMKYYEDMPEGEYVDESSRKLVKEGAGAGYTVRIKDLKFGGILEKKLIKGKKSYDDYYVCQVEILPGEYEIEAEDYYNDFFWQEHEFGDTPTAKIDGGVATISYSTNSYDEDEAEDELRHEVARRTMDICFDYGHGWVHANLSREKIEADHVEVENSEFYGSIDKLELDAPDLADAVNCGYASIFDRDDEDEDEEPVDESTGAAKINLTWDEFNKLCDLIDMDWKRWNKNNAKSIPLVADRAVEHLEWITNKKLKGLDPKTVTISYTIPGSGIDEYDTGTQNTQTIYELIEGMAWDNHNPYNESDYAPLGRGKPRKPKDVTIRVHIEWGGGYEDGSEEDVEQWLDDVDLPDVVYIKIPREFYDDDNVSLDLSSKLSKTFDGYVQDYDYREVDPKRIPIGARILYWRPETDIMEEF